MIRVLIALLCCVFVASSFAEPTTAPTSALSTESLANGDVIFTPPDGWKLQGKAKTGKLAVYIHTNPKALMAVNVDTQQIVLDQSAAAKIGQSQVQKIKANAAAGKIEIIDQPKADVKSQFFLRIEHSYRNKENAEMGHQLQVYRVIGLNLVAVACTAFTESADEAKPIFADAEKTLASVHSSKQGAPAGAARPKTKPATRPTAAPAAKIAFNAPAGWTEETNDNSSGIVATYHDPVDTFNMIVISVRPLPDEAKKDPKLRETVIENMVSGEKAQFKFDVANVVGDAETVKDNRFLKKQRIRYERQDAKIQVTSRIKRVGDAIVSVAMASLESTAADVDKLADDVAMTLKPLSGK